MVYIFLNMRVIDIYAPHIHRYIFTLKKWRQRPPAIGHPSGAPHFPPFPPKLPPVASNRPVTYSLTHTRIVISAAAFNSSEYADWHSTEVISVPFSSHSSYSYTFSINLKSTYDPIVLYTGLWDHIFIEMKKNPIAEMKRTNFTKKI